MNVRRVLLLCLAALFGVVAVLGGSTDLRVDAATNCGSALLPADTDRPTLRSGDVADDEFAASSVAAECDHLVTGRRLLIALPTAVAVALLVVARRERQAHEATGF